MMVIAPAHRCAISAQSAGMQVAGAYGRECARRRRCQTGSAITPAHCCAVGAQSAGETSTGAYRRECPRRRGAVIRSPAHRRAIRAQSAGVKKAGAYRRECARRGRRLTIPVISPAHCCAVGAQPAGMPPAGAHGCESFIRRRPRPTGSIMPPAYRRAVLQQRAVMRFAGAYGAKSQSRGYACGCRRVVDGLLRACVVRICEQGEQQQCRRCEGSEEVERVFRTHERGGGGVNRMFGILLLQIANDEGIEGFCFICWVVWHHLNNPPTANWRFSGGNRRLLASQ